MEIVKLAVLEEYEYGIFLVWKIDVLVEIWQFFILQKHYVLAVHLDQKILIQEDFKLGFGFIHAGEIKRK